MQHAPLTPIDSNRRPRCQLSDSQKHVLYGRALAGQSTREIATAEGLERLTVQTILRRARARNTVTATPRIGWLKIYDLRNERRILRSVRINPKITFAKLRNETGLEFSRSTYYRILRANGITQWLAKKRPLLLEAHAKLRFEFARK